MKRPMFVDYGETNASPETTTIAAGDRSTELFIDPKYFPLQLCGETIHFEVEYGPQSEIFVCSREDNSQRVHFSEMDVFEMNNYQKTITFLYLVSAVMPDDN